jgi:hypothetical protein
MTDDVMTSDDFQKSEGMKTLGPHYFSSRRFAEEVMSGVETEFFEPALKKFADELYTAMLDKAQNWIIGDAESNVQTHIWRTVDQIVSGILSGEKWIVERYVLGGKYDCGTIRKTLAQHVPKELQDARIADLEEQVKALKEQVEWLRR